MFNLSGKFKAKYGDQLKGDPYWLNRISKEDRQVFVRCGLHHARYGVLGGMARAATADRDHKGRFV